MPTSAAEPGEQLLLATGPHGRWWRIAGGAVAESGSATLPPPGPHPVALAVPGEEVTIRWLDLDDGLTLAQAAAAARLLLAEQIAAPLATTHVAAGPGKGGSRPIALVDTARMDSWLSEARSAGIEPEAMIPTTMLLPEPDAGLARRSRDGVDDFRGARAAFAIEPELALAMIGQEPLVEIDEPAFEAGLANALVQPAIDLRQGPYALRRRRFLLIETHARRLGVLAAALAVITLLVAVANLLAYTFAADRLEAEALAIAPAGASSAPAVGFAAMTSALAEAVRSTPSLELSRLDYRGGRLAAGVTADGAPTILAFRARLEAAGFVVEPSPITNAGGRTVTELGLRWR